MNFMKHRPERHFKEENQELAEICNELKIFLNDVQDSFTYDTLVLPENKLNDLALIIVEFAEDLIHKIGIWKSLEKYNSKYFGTPLPFILHPNQNMPKRAINEKRIHYLLWNKYTEFEPSLILAPTHRDLYVMAENISDFFRSRKNKVLSNSSIKVLLNQPNDYGWDVKRKLIWLGQHSYLFRNCFEKYIEDRGGVAETPIIDDFVCQEKTEWSGLGVPDILSSLLKITRSQRKELQSWYERHLAYFKIESVNEPIVTANNLLNNEIYTIRAGDNCNLFKPGQVIMGGLTLWNSEWYWSGRQSNFGEIPQSDLHEMIQIFKQKSSKIVYRYNKSDLKYARQRTKVFYRNFIKYHGDDFAVFSDGYSMAAAIQKQHRLEYEAKPKEAVKVVMKKHNLKNPYPNYQYPKALLESDNGIGIFLNPEEGLEIMRDFNDILSGLKKKGVNLTLDELDAIKGFVESKQISIHFVNKLVGIYGTKSIMEAFLIRNHEDIDSLTFLFRKYKGQFYGNRYPNYVFI